MSPEISERSFEEAIECGLLQHGPDACAGDAIAVRETSPPYGDTPPGGYRKRDPLDYDRALCLLPRDVVDFVLATQPKEWQKLAQHHGAAVKEQFLKRLAAETERRGALDMLRNGIKDSGVKFRLAYFRPASGLNEETQRLHAANLFAVVRQVHYSTKNDQPSPGLRPARKSLDLVLFLNGIPIFTAELKNPLTGQDVEDAIRQYKTDRDPREPLFAYGRCLAHFAVDPDLVYVATQLSGPKTRFLPFNQGKFGSAGNPPVPPTRKGYATAYLWEETWARDSVLDLVRQFIHEVEEEDEKGRLRTAVCVPGAGADLRGRRPREALRLRAAPAAAAPRRPHRAAARSTAEYRHGVVPHPADQQGKIPLERKTGVVDPVGTKGVYGTAPEELEALSRIIAELNERFGLNLGPEHRLTLRQMMGKLDDDAALDAAARVNTRENVRLTFDQKVEHVIQEIVEWRTMDRSSG